LGIRPSAWKWHRAEVDQVGRGSAGLSGARGEAGGDRRPGLPRAEADAGGSVEEEMFDFVSVERTTSDDLAEGERRTVEGGIAGSFLGGGHFGEFAVEGTPGPGGRAL
jgi:hypothetical protein